MDAFTARSVTRKYHLTLEKEYTLPIERIALFELVEHANLNLACVTILGDGSDNFYSHFGVRLRVDSFDNFAERSLA